MITTIISRKNINGQEVFQGRWGYHPCSLETFLKLKEAHLLLLRAYKDIKALLRYNSKLNPNGERPKCYEYLINRGYYKRSPNGNMRYGYTIAPQLYLGTNPDYPVLHYYGRILSLYQQARKPVENANDVKIFDIPDDLWEIIESLKEFYEIKDI